LAAVFFALEIVLGGFGGGFFVVPALIGVAMSALFTFLVRGTPPPFARSSILVRWDYSLLFYLLVAALAALAAVVYVRLLPKFLDLWERVNLPSWVRLALAGLLVGLVGFWVPDIYGTGLAQLQQIFSGTSFTISALLVLAIAKIILTPSSLGSGFAGEVVGPALLIGSSLGLAFGQLAALIFPDLSISPLAFAFVGSAAMLSAAFHAPLFAAMLVLEMTADYRFIVPVLVGAAVSFALARAYLPGSAYTFELEQRGIHLEQETVIDIEKEDHLE
jgi:CIC family chloride channel protein